MKLTKFAILVVAVISGGAAASASDRPWQLTFLAGPMSVNDSSEIFLEGELGRPAAALGIAGAREVLDLSESVHLAIEAQLLRRTEADGFWEVAGLGVARWQVLDSPGLRLSIGYGPSWVHRRSDSVADGDSELSDWLGVLMGEISLWPNADEPWSVSLRYQHASSTFGLFGDSGSKDDGTALLFGFNYRFGF